ncbi:M20/M25/M40 family metallo-hydrolase [Terriglobus aquaticus]|uniref:Carboxypeptidase Q n=1 Tax=Terriglobus aquaticus TaxID=940139 RepID=A0ABW9KNK9_9BACT|nr:M20/M25/M40 family metallo-hydrolase [Terriglobus aquaticus]
MPSPKVLLSLLSVATAAVLALPASAQREGSAQPAVSGPITAKYQADASKILAAAAADNDGYTALTYLCDHIGNRNSGTPQLNTAVQWGAELMRKAGLENVTVQPAMVPHWVRGHESAEILSPDLHGMPRKLHMLGLGMSVGTPAQGITAPVIFVHTFDELDALPPDSIKGKIVVYNPGWHGYGVGSLYRTTGASRAAAKGAVAMLVRSATGLVEQTPHTGTLRYDEKQPKIPAAAISPEDALLIERLAKDGTVSVHLQMDAHQEADVQSGNVVGEIRGSEKPNEVVVLGGHIDSWDVGQGAQDDGSGIMAAYAAVKLIHDLGLKPKRTLRLAFWVNEENGGAGGRAYRDSVAKNIKDQVAAMEMDDGAEAPLGIGYTVIARTPGRRAPSMQQMMRQGPPPFNMDALTPEQKQAFNTVQQIAALLQPIGADKVFPAGGGSDIGPIVALGVPSLAPITVAEHYFDWHHTEADTLDKVNLADFRKDIGLLAVTTFVLADMDGQLVGAKIPDMD